ncbi:class I SAM-dependent methyltransferase [Microbacterium aurugineum]|uniref:class I SAM-dependent methyltransferase n=1 Tax=Microbacterium aurugineum TaxID=2851642 RepID=UPI0020BE796B|nr:class I SAM-dependent methyltransferase [Microbacterium aurugineum]MCK8475667.1 class I SAM-dependent methyltransferase [Microbacterium aurugineum]
MTDDAGSDVRVRKGYAARAEEYAQLFGDIDQMDADDRERIARWAEGIDGPLLDAGCGPGHWTAFLAGRGHAAEGIDLVPEFISLATARYPGVPYRVASLAEADLQEGSLRGVLAWYSLIHASPDELPSLLAAVRSALEDGGALLLGFFDGPDGEPFPHAVTTAHYWSVDGMSALLEESGFSVIDRETRVPTGARPHASISAVAV